MDENPLSDVIIEAVLGNRTLKRWQEGTLPSP